MVPANPHFASKLLQKYWLWYIYGKVSLSYPEFEKPLQRSAEISTMLTINEIKQIWSPTLFLWLLLNAEVPITSVFFLEIREAALVSGFFRFEVCPCYGMRYSIRNRNVSCTMSIDCLTFVFDFWDFSNSATFAGQFRFVSDSQEFSLSGYPFHFTRYFVW